jgi:hypothetical protein
MEWHQQNLPMRVIPAMSAIASLICVAIGLAVGWQEEHVVSTGLFNQPTLRLTQIRQSQQLVRNDAKQDGVAEQKPDRPFQRGEIRDNVALVAELNTRWEESRLSLITSFDIPTTQQLGPEIVGSSPAELAVKKWMDEGTAAGHRGILYDNRDRDHSNLNRSKFPRLAFVEYDAAARKAGADWGLRIGQAFDLPTFGNSSTSLVGSPFWRSNPRTVLTEDLLTKIVYNEFVNNQMYCYPEHNDFDPEHGDVYPANTPFWVISQGSSSSDQPFMEAIALTLAAFVSCADAAPSQPKSPANRRRLFHRQSASGCVSAVGIRYVANGAIGTRTHNRQASGDGSHSGDRRRSWSSRSGLLPSTCGGKTFRHASCGGSRVSYKRISASHGGGCQQQCRLERSVATVSLERAAG